MIVIKLNGELEEKLKTIALLKGVETDELLEELREKAEETIRKEIEREYREVVSP